MTAPDETSRPMALIDRVITELRNAIAHAEAATALAGSIRDSLSDPLNTPLNTPLNALPTRDEILVEHRRAHRRGASAKIESDPELQAFIAARIDTRTYAQVIEAVKAHFPPERQTSVSALQRWIKKREAKDPNRP